MFNPFFHLFLLVGFGIVLYVRTPKIFNFCVI